MIKEAIILAGGLGTRLRKTVPDLPKCMAPVAGLPFLTHIIRFFLSQGVEKFIFSVGFKYKVIESFLNEKFPTLNYQLSIEQEPLGTGGAILLACKRTTEENVIVANGDSIFKTDIDNAVLLHYEKTATCTLFLKPMKNFDRYGVVEIDNDNQVINFREKQFFSSGDINAGVYVLNIESFIGENLPEKFSFEKDWLEKKFSTHKVYGKILDGYFIDIGIRDDYLKAQDEMKHIPLLLENISSNWTIFIDRDGVINYEKENNYILNWNEFQFYPGIAEAIRIISGTFKIVIVVSNQRGIGRGLMTEEDLHDIHQKMIAEILKGGGRIDKIYYCTAEEAHHFCRKPNPGMALQAAKDFPGIDMSKSIMVGNKASDMQFGRNAGMYTVYLKTTHPDQTIPDPDIDLAFDSLLDFAKSL